MEACAVSIKNMTKKFSEFGIENLNLEIPSHYITGVIGRNGAGKTTLIKSILGIMPLDEGEITILGKTMKKEEITLKNEIGVVLDDGCFYESMTVKAMKNMIRRFYRNWEEETFERFRKQFNLSESKKIKELSTGMRAKFNIALALSHQAKLILLDEPSSGLDPVAREELMDILSELMETEDITVVLSTHITSDLDRTADYIVLVDQGRVILNLPKDELLDSHRIVRGGVDVLTPELMKHCVSVKKGGFGFEALTAKPAVLKREFPQLIFEKPSVEDIMRFYTKTREEN